ncbi:putative 3,4-dihydroxy-2-butanone kinase isoform X1 [Alnus glutinosa]|uniref:putative 3,4-dihydroxy-2-butanone kinase isoform X1 n=1 Tax=Alnus glutinosa TaxID=3517 RepID=UPI002D77D302|nr:putative 3,4-dihydroxy-2-butanone kinase isoform X1 [Alnus glutinosa]
MVLIYIRNLAVRLGSESNLHDSLVISPYFDTFMARLQGGGSGHEPAHAGFVGEGMLTAAICGDVFASPPVDSILAGIRAVTGPMGCLLIVKNYTGDRLNFGLAAEQAKSEGYKVETVIVGDDCALPPPHGIAGRRGLAGTILIHKVAGAAAAAGLSLAEVATEAKCASEMVGTMGVALSVCTLPGRGTSDRLGPGKMELGLGIHGEPGAALADIQPVDVVVSHVLTQILLPSLSRPPQLNQQGQILEAAIEAAANAVINLRDGLNEWDSKLGDGDCGSTMHRGATAILEDIKNYPLNDAAETVNEIGSSIRRVMGGTSGIIYNIFCKAAYAQLTASSQSVVTAKQWAEALEASIAAVSKYGGASAGYRTLLDALIPASSMLQERLNAGDVPYTAFVLSSEAALAGAEATKHMQAQAGRSSYVSGEILSSVPDPGAVAAASWYRAAALAVKELCNCRILYGCW